MGSSSKVSVEKVSDALTAVVYGKGVLQLALTKTLAKQHLRVLRIENEDEALSILEKPAYIFFFITNSVSPSKLRVQFEEALQSASRFSSKMVVIFDNIDASIEKNFYSLWEKKSWPVALAEIKGEFESTDKEKLDTAISKIARLAFSSHKTDKVIILGKERLVMVQKELASRNLSVQDVFNQFNRLKKRRRLPRLDGLGLLIIFLVVTTFFLSPFLLLGIPSSQAFFNLQESRKALASGHFSKAESEAVKAKENLGLSKTVATSYGSWFFFSVPPLEKYFTIILLGETAADMLERVARIGPLASDFPLNSTRLVTKFRQELGPIDRDLGLIEAQVFDITGGIPGKVLNFFGVPTKKLTDLADQIPQIRKNLTQVDRLISVWSDIVSTDGTKTYLLVFQNSAELRPTGGFIGSYGLVRFNHGRMLDWKIYDIYSADGQLRGQISPPDELLHFLGQPSWFMRDSNWSPDFQLTAKRLIWFLEKETGEKVDGVIALNLEAVQKVLEATGPLTITDMNQTVSADDFFQKAEYSAEIDFFAGSTQKKDFLGAVASALLGKITSESGENWAVVGQAVIKALDQKDILLFFTSGETEKMAVDNGWSGTINVDTKNSLMVVEANFGLNKANYFVKRNVQVSSVIGKNGDIDTTLVVQYLNNSPSTTWPGGVYKNYLRVLIPQGSQLLGIDIGDGRKPILSTVLTGSQLQKTQPDQFFVFQSTEGEYQSFGTLIEIPIQTHQVITLHYKPPTKVVFGKDRTEFAFTYLKQPGANAENFNFILEYPSFLEPVNPNTALVFPQKLIYNSKLETDKQLKFVFKNNFTQEK